MDVEILKYNLQMMNNIYQLLSEIELKSEELLSIQKQSHCQMIILLNHSTNVKNLQNIFEYQNNQFTLLVKELKEFDLSFEDISIIQKEFHSQTIELLSLFEEKSKIE